MPELHAQHWVKENRDFIFDLVADVEAYPDFLPAIQEVKILSRTGDRLSARVDVGYGKFYETFISDVKLDRKNYTITATQQEGRLKHLLYQWQFMEQDGGTDIKCSGVVEFYPSLLKVFATPLLEVANRHITQAFIARAQYLASKRL